MSERRPPIVLLKPEERPELNDKSIGDQAFRILKEISDALKVPGSDHVSVSVHRINKKDITPEEKEYLSESLRISGWRLRLRFYPADKQNKTSEHVKIYLRPLKKNPEDKNVIFKAKR